LLSEQEKIGIAIKRIKSLNPGMTASQAADEYFDDTYYDKQLVMPLPELVAASSNGNSRAA
jgi:hypothetical protein